jgi:hypothetical protein
MNVASGVPAGLSRLDPDKVAPKAVGVGCFSRPLRENSRPVARFQAAPSSPVWLDPWVGADLLHLREIERIESSMVSIGGAGTFDGFLLMGILALYLA